MSDLRFIVILGVVLVLLAIVVWAVARNKRRAPLRAQFGPKYGRAVRQHGSVTRAESALEARRERVRELDIRPLSSRKRIGSRHRGERPSHGSSTIRPAPSPRPTASSRAR